jgi:hypothetical protein
VSQADPQGDAGGNKEEVCTPACGHKLHAFWDDVLGTSKTLSSAIRVGKGLQSPNAAQADDLTTATWIRESFDLARQSVYVAPIGAGNGPFTITASYRQAAKSVAKQQVALAGARLANLLNREL